MAVVYLALHKFAAQFSRKPGSKLLWFFSVVTRPLIRPVRRWLAPGTEEKRIISAALIFYTLLWLFMVLLARLWTTALA